MGSLRLSERILAAYFLYTSVLALLLPLRPSVSAVTLGIDAAVIGGMLLIAQVEPLRGRPFLRALRDVYPLALILLGYRQMGWFAPAHHTYALERLFVPWDRLLLVDWGAKSAIEVLGPVLPSILELSYSLFYAIPLFSLAMLYVYGQRERAEELLATAAAGAVTVYALFPFFPSEPPRVVFFGQNQPAYAGVFRHFNEWLLGGYGIHTSVFPSTHVAGAVSCALVMWRILPERRWVGCVLLPLAGLIAVSTVYGRYHYAADAVAGLLVGLAAQAAVKLALRGRLG
jgi:membrane-associated phospholipid phosphatase